VLRTRPRWNLRLKNTEKEVAKIKNDIALAQKRLQLASERADLTTQLANVSVAAEEKAREQLFSSSSTISHDAERFLGRRANSSFTTDANADATDAGDR